MRTEFSNKKHLSDERPNYLTARFSLRHRVRFNQFAAHNLITERESAASRPLIGVCRTSFIFIGLGFFRHHGLTRKEKHRC